MILQRHYLLSLAALTGLSCSLAALDANAETAPALSAIEGNWATEGYGAVVHMRACDDEPDRLCGWLVWAWEPEKFEPDAIGALILEGAQYDGEKWKRARIHNLHTGQRYRASIRQPSPDVLRLKGCAVGIVCQTQTWRRLESLPHAAGLNAVALTETPQTGS